MTYHLISKELRDYFITGHKLMFITSLAISIIMASISLFGTAFGTTALALSIIFLTISIIFFISWSQNKKKYGKWVSLCNETITLHNYKGVTIAKINLSNCNQIQLNVLFDEVVKNKPKECLVLYNGGEPYDNMEYISFCNNPDMTIIQNADLIKMVKSLCLQKEP